MHLVNDDIPLDGVIHGYDGLDDKRIDLDFCWISRPFQVLCKLQKLI